MWEGKKVNTFEWDGRVLDVEKSLEIIHETSRQYQELFSNAELRSQYDYWQKDDFFQATQ